MNRIAINKDKSIGQVIYVVEGERTEFTLLEQIFIKILDYSLITYRKNEKLIKKYVNKQNKFSNVCIIQSEKSNIASLDNQMDYLDAIYTELAEEYGIDVETSSVYFLFDRDPQSNNNPGIIIKLLDLLGNSMDNGNEMNGMLLLSYPCMIMSI